MVLGNPDGDITLVEFFDYNCGFCKRAMEDVVKIMETDSNVRVVLKEFPILGPDSLAAHQVSMAFRKLAPEKYGEYHMELLGADVRATEALAIELAKSFGVDEEALRARHGRSRDRGFDPPGLYARRCARHFRHAFLRPRRRNRVRRCRLGHAAGQDRQYAAVPKHRVLTGAPSLNRRETNRLGHWLVDNPARHEWVPRTPPAVYGLRLEEKIP
jgi:hypothetical protein